MADKNPKTELIFSEVRYFVPSECSDEVKQLLKQGGAKKEFYISDLVTHVISDTDDEALVNEAREYNLPIVTQNWVTLSTKAGMKLPAKPFSPQKDCLFTGIIICPSKIACDDLDKLWAMVTYHGGTCQLNLTPSCTHLVIPKACGEKYKAAIKYNGKIKIVTPSWVVDCIKSDRMQDEKKYLPSEEDDDNTESTNSETNDSAVSMATPCETSTPSSESLKMVEPNCKAFTTPTTIATPHKINKAGDVENYVKDDIVEVKETPIKTEGESSHKHELDENMASRHEPCPDKLVQQVTAPNGEKPEGKKWNEEMDKDSKNLGTGEESSGQSSLLAGCVFVVSDYQDCMDHAILDTWIEVIKSNGGKVETFYTNRCTHLLCLNQRGKVYPKALADGKKIVTAHWLNDVLTDKKMQPPSNPLHFPVPFPYKMPECKNLSITVTGYTGIERLLVKNMIFVVGANYTGYLTRSNTHIICKSSVGEKYVKAREWGIPCVNAKWLGDIVSSGKVSPCALKRYSVFDELDDLSVNKDLVHLLMKPWTGDPATHYITPDQYNTNEETNGKKRKQDEVEDSNVEEIQTKRRRLSNSTTVEMNSNTPRVLFTGLSIGRVSTLMKMLTELGGVAAESHCTCTHLVATKIIRTVKFLSAISVSQFIVTPNWLEESYEKKKFLDPKSYLLKDSEAEKEYKMQLSISLERAQNKKLLKDIQVYATQNVQPSPSSLKEIVDSAGGQFLSSIPSKTTLRSLKNSKTREGNPAFLVVTCQEDLELCDIFIKCGVDIHSTEVILAGVLTQQLDYNAYKVKFV